MDTDTLPSPLIRQQLRVAAGLTQAEVADAIGAKRKQPAYKLLPRSRLTTFRSYQWPRS
ncbi:hypothetical protein GCM10010329_86230 [Streptomyces spiroverticillatus]|uniref:Helix-turn-helix domain-containing protein n=1 Tax=Streptomyces finlayi TaxID=67296 RepID=A0A918X9U0_9ACTN|nr:hypothetical protein [Streptomyces finlayi]GHA51011.1 hypothetical protein GCM10010329_86230 [Streptomyces spiroverticillatus]GHD20074.1 hypothetical protein GCM10010334_84290 [Streptomyces finlayi]